MSADLLTVDADGHVLEPADTWQRYIDPKFKDRALRIDLDADGFENLFIDNQPTLMLRGRLGALGGIEAETPAEKLAFQIPASAPIGTARRRAATTRTRGSPCWMPRASTRSCCIRRSASRGKARSPIRSSRSPTAAPTTAGSSTSAAPIRRASTRSRTSRC